MIPVVPIVSISSIKLGILVENKKKEKWFVLLKHEAGIAMRALDLFPARR